MPTFCRHNRLLQNCSICSREQSIEPRPVVSGRHPPARSTQPKQARRPTGSSGRQTATGLRVRHLERGADDGYGSPLVPGLRSSADAERLAGELAFAASRLTTIEIEPPGLMAEVADPDLDLEERTWLAFQIAYISPLDGDRPFASIESVRTTWESGRLPDLDTVPVGPRSAYTAGRGAATLEAYRAWGARAGSQAKALTGEPSWTPQRRFARAFERLALPGLDRDARFELLVMLGHLDCYELSAAALELGGPDEVTLAAKRLLGIGDPMLLERRAATLADSCAVPLAALDLGLHNWGTSARCGLGVPIDREPEPEQLSVIRAALGL